MGDDVAAARVLARRIRRHAEQIAGAGRSPLCVALMSGAAADLEAGGIVAELFAGLPAPPGSVPALRLLGALHRLVLAGHAPALAAFYPSAGGTQPPDRAWPVAARVLREHREEVRARLPMTVQTNEPGRAAALYGALLWLAGRTGLPVRLLEIGASAGLNLHADRFTYVVGGVRLGAARSPLAMHEPWQGVPVADPLAAARALHVVERAGCDPAPLDPADPDDRLTVESYVWPDELERLARVRAALEVAAADRVRVQAAPTAPWLERALAAGRDGQLTVLWQSVVRQYVDDDAWREIEAVVTAAAVHATDARSLAWVTLEPGEHRIADFVLEAVTWPGGERHRLADAGNHGPPVAWSVPG